MGLLVRNWVEDLWAWSWAETCVGFAPGRLWAWSWAETCVGFAPGRLWAGGLVCPGMLDRSTCRVRVDPTLWLVDLFFSAEATNFDSSGELNDVGSTVDLQCKSSQNTVDHAG